MKEKNLDGDCINEGIICEKTLRIYADLLKETHSNSNSLDLWTNPDKVEPFLATWGERLLAAT